MPDARCPRCDDRAEGSETDIVICGVTGKRLPGPWSTVLPCRCRVATSGLPVIPTPVSGPPDDRPTESG